MAGQCFPLVGGRVMRATRLDGCGRPDTTQPACAQVTSKGFVSIAVTANIDTGTAITVQNANGDNCVNEQPAAQLTGYTVQITFCEVDPDIFAMYTGQAVVLDPQTGEAVGFRVNTGVSSSDSAVGLEVWTKVPGVTCPVDDEGNPIPNVVMPSGYILFPFLQGGVFGDFTIENGAVSFVVQNAVTKDGSGWGVGPYHVTLDENGEPGPLTTPIDGKDHLHVQVTYVEPPTPACGCGPIPTYQPATGATAGTPGDFTPLGSDVPANLAAMTSITASPNTAWTVGQYVDLGDGSTAHWSGTAWVAGKA